MKRSLLASLMLAVLFLLVFAFDVVSLAEAEPPVARPADFAYDPRVAEMMAQVQTDTVYLYDAQLSGVVSVTVGGGPYTITTRYTTYTVPIQKATQFAYEHFQALGLAASYHTWSACGLSARNVIGVLTGTVSPDQIVLVTAHLDSTSRRNTPSANPAPGADDNASGSTGVMIAADILSHYHFARTVRFVLFTGEEQGLCGSGQYANSVAAAGEDIVAVYNLDMIAWDADAEPVVRLHTRHITNTGYSADLAIAGVFTNVVQAYGLSDQLVPIVTADNETRSDHSRFWSNGYPAILAIEDDYDDFNAYYHTSNDRLEQLNLAYFTSFVQASVGTAAHLALPVTGNQAYHVYVPLLEANFAAP